MSGAAQGAALAAADPRTIAIRWLGRIEYGAALALQESLVARRLDGEATDHLLLLEHDPVYTLGRGADAADLQGAGDRLGVPVFRVGRGGGATFHGPGQLVSYPIVRLMPTGRDVHRYVRGLEQVLIASCARLGIAAAARPGITGVWVGSAKIASIGIAVRRGLAFHGTALNVATELGFFDAIVPCRMGGLQTTSVACLQGAAPPVAEVAKIFADCFVAEFGHVTARPDRALGTVDEVRAKNQV